MDSSKSSSLQRAVDVAGGQTALAKLVGVKSQSVRGWIIRGEVPIKRVPKVVEAVDGAVTEHDLRPDFFPKVA